MKAAPISFLLILSAVWTGVTASCAPSVPQVTREYLLEIRPEAGIAVTPEMRVKAIHGIEEVLRPLNFTGVKVEPAAQAAQIKLTVRFPVDYGATDPEVRNLIAQSLDVHTQSLALVRSDSSPALVSEMQAGKIIPGCMVIEPYDATTGQAEVLELGNQLKGRIVDSAWTSFELQGYQINVRLNSDAAEKMRALSRANIGRRLAILVDDKVVSAPTINSELGEQFVITGQFKQEEAEKLATFLKNPLANPVVIVNTSPPGASPAAP